MRTMHDRPEPVRRPRRRADARRGWIPVPSLLAAIACTALGVDAVAATLRVSPDGSGEYPTLAAAIEAAAVTGDEIVLAQGTFSGEGNRDLDLLGKSVAIRSETGNPYGCIIDCGGSGSEPHRAFLFRGGETLGTEISGILIRNGSVSANGAPMNHGGAIYCVAEVAGETTGPTIRHCIFEGCSAVLGGAIYIGQGAYPQIIDCYFVGNRGQGGAIAVNGDAQFLISQCGFERNAGEPPAILMGGTSDVEIDGCTIFFNEGGAIEVLGQGLLAIGNSTIAANTGTRAALLCAGNASIDVHATIVAFNGGSAASCLDSGSIDLTCADIVGNRGGDWIGCVASQAASDGNMSEDPRFCNAPAGNFQLDSHSPCLPEGNLCVTQLGSKAQGCEETPAERTSWGRVRSLFR